MSRLLGLFLIMTMAVGCGGSTNNAGAGGTGGGTGGMDAAAGTGGGTGGAGGTGGTGGAVVDAPGADRGSDGDESDAGAVGGTGGAALDAGGGTGGGSDAAAGTGGAGGSGGSDAGTDGGARPWGFLHTEGARILDSSGREVRLTGLSWFGFELPSFALHGLDYRSMGELLDVVRDLGYNVIRVPYSNEFLTGKPATGIDATKNPDLVGLRGLELMDKLIEKAKARGLRIILDRHRPTSTGQSELWYSNDVSEATWIDDWTRLATRYRNDPTVIGADLHNEPHGSATWGSGNTATDWRLAAERAGNAILAVHPEWLIIVEGIETAGGRAYWWGGNLRAARDFPVRLSVPGRLVYSAHDYPASLYPQSWFSDPTYPANLPGLWRETWGYLMEEGIAPVWVGEFGTKYETQSDRQWLSAILSYMDASRINFAVWCLNSDSTATQGLLFPDWTTIRTEKQAVIAPHLAPLIE